MTLVDPEVNRRKFEHELELWREQEDVYRRRGWLLLGQRELSVDIGFLGRLPVAGQTIPAMSACVRVDFTDYDLSPPSVEFIDPLTGEYAPPQVQALIGTDEGPRDLVREPPAGRFGQRAHPDGRSTTRRGPLLACQRRRAIVGILGRPGSR